MSVDDQLKQKASGAEAGPIEEAGAEAGPIEEAGAEAGPTEEAGAEAGQIEEGGAEEGQIEEAGKSSADRSVDFNKTELGSDLGDIEIGPKQPKLPQYPLEQFGAKRHFFQYHWFTKL
ncbi:hypothetical protein EOD39_3844 [Acipenser ruthenus]|uniref:Uncharacterized protein n=1 Tax=Acipenser ruthenus TaxID=7906 RepID=A0A444UL57_ACIRT|nr:hypothetical protein EOD39_3844 [Acipenser ruthenus]